MNDKVNTTTMGGLRSFDSVPVSSPDDIRRAGGSDPMRHDAQIPIDRTVTNHDKPGFNASYQHRDPYVASVESKAIAMGTPNVDGTYSR